MNRFTPFAKAQAFGLAAGFALALWTANHLGYGLNVFLIGTGAAWLGWEFFFGKSAPSARSDMRALAYALLTGFAFPWIGCALAALVDMARP